MSPLSMPLRPVSPIRGHRTPEQVAKVLGVSLAKVEALLRGPLDYFVIKGRRYVSHDALEAYRRRVAS